MKPYQGILQCVECFVKVSSDRPDTSARDRQRQRMEMKLKETKKMGVKYGTAEHTKVVGDKVVISEQKLDSPSAEKVASAKPKTGSKKTAVAKKDFKRNDEDHIPGD